MTRLVLPELLDQLPPEDPAARASRRDLRRLNTAMGSTRWFRGQCRRRMRPGDRVLELGAGDGLLRAAVSAGVQWDGLDLAPRPPDWPREAQWHRGDALAFDGWGDYTVLLGNLVFHHFQGEQLASLGRAAAPHLRLILAHEPSRDAWTRLSFRVLARLLRVHPVTQHDANVSITAGFRGEELPAALGLLQPPWKVRTRWSPRGAQRMVAERSA